MGILIPFPAHAIALPNCAIEPPRIGGTLRAMIGGKVYIGLIGEEPATAVRSDLAELLPQTGRVRYFKQDQRCAFECLLPVIGLARPVRAVEWPTGGPAVVFGSGVLKVPLARAPDRPDATILPFAPSRPAHSRAIQ